MHLPSFHKPSKGQCCASRDPVQALSLTSSKESKGSTKRKPCFPVPFLWSVLQGALQPPRAEAFLKVTHPSAQLRTTALLCCVRPEKQKYQLLTANDTLRERQDFPISISPWMSLPSPSHQCSYRQQLLDQSTSAVITGRTCADAQACSSQHRAVLFISHHERAAPTPHSHASGAM